MQFALGSQSWVPSAHSSTSEIIIERRKRNATNSIIIHSFQSAGRKGTKFCTYLNSWIHLHYIQHHKNNYKIPWYWCMLHLLDIYPISLHIRQCLNRKARKIITLPIVCLSPPLPSPRNLYLLGLTYWSFLIQSFSFHACPMVMPRHLCIWWCLEQIIIIII